MTESIARCPYCVNAVRVQPSFWERMGMRTAKRSCPSCRRVFETRDAHAMGSAYGRWLHRFADELGSMVEDLPMLPEAAIHRVLGNPSNFDTRTIGSVEELLRSCTRFNHAALAEMARGREASLEVAYLCDGKGKPEVVAVLGVSSPESGVREREQLIARQGLSNFVLYTYPSMEGAEVRVKQAIHAKLAQHTVGVRAGVRVAAPLRPVVAVHHGVSH